MTVQAIRRLLVANRGEIARRILRTAHAMGIQTVAVYSEADVSAMHVEEAGSAVALGGVLSADAYLRIDKLLAAAKASGADAVHPGYGFLSENADFAQAVLDAGLVWVGPPPAAIRALGNKASAKQLAFQHKVPCLPGYQGADQSDATLAAEAAKIGYPLMVKATAGGGGRGMRLVQEAASLQAALDGARSEAISSFGSGDLLLERALLRPRHVEVQVFADAHGHCIHLGERDCSVQRRHQKLIEESPSPAVNADLRERMGACAVALAQAAGYVGAGTVEFLLERDQFFLMEMNTRLQVEHPVTEALTGLDLVEWQLRIAQGEALPLRQQDVQLRGHAIEVRLCAEDDDFSPHTGRVGLFAEPPHARFDHALRAGAEVTPFYDSMLGKLIVHASTRKEAIARLGAALAGMRVLGLPTNRGFLAASLAHPVFQAGQALIPFLAEHGDAIRNMLQAQQADVLLPAVVAMYFRGGAATDLPCPFAKTLRVRYGDEVQLITVKEKGRGVIELSHGGTSYTGACERIAEGKESALRVSIDGVAHTVDACRTAGSHWHVQVSGTDLWLIDETLAPAVAGASASLATELRAPFNGKVIAVNATVGDAVRRGDVLLVIESMKLEHAVCATRDAVVATVAVEAGQQTSPGQVLLRFEA